MVSMCYNEGFLEVTALVAGQYLNGRQYSFLKIEK